MLHRASLLLPLACLAWLSLGSPVVAEAATEAQRAFLTVDDVLRTEPSPAAQVVARLKAGQAVWVGERRGFWRRVDGTAGPEGGTSASSVAGWVRLSTLRLPNAKPASGLAALRTGREASGNTTLVSGARSVAGRGALLAADALRAAKVDEATFDRLPRETVAADARARFIAEGGLIARSRILPGARGVAVIAESTPEAIERQVAAQIFGLVRPVSDPTLQQYLAHVGAVLTQGNAIADTPGTPSWRFVLLDTPSLATFALPNGLVLISRGLFVELTSEDELAAVLAREISHIRAQHHWRRLREPPLETYLRPLATDLEFLADAEGARVAAAAGYDATALISVLERVDRATAAGRDTALLRALTPSVSDRIATLAAAATPELERAAVLSPAAGRIRQFLTGEK